MTDFVVVYVTVSSAQEGERIARALVDERLAACVNRLGAVRSTYRWEGQVEQSDEELLIIKTNLARFNDVKQRVSALHSYSVPEIIALPILAGSEAYLRWLNEQLIPGET